METLFQGLWLHSTQSANNANLTTVDNNKAAKQHKNRNCSDCDQANLVRFHSLLL